MAINLQPGLELTDINFHMSIRPDEGQIIYTSMNRSSWLDRNENSTCPIKKGEHFDIEIRAETDSYEVEISSVTSLPPTLANIHHFKNGFFAGDC